MKTALEITRTRTLTVTVLKMKTIAFPTILSKVRTLTGMVSAIIRMKTSMEMV